MTTESAQKLEALISSGRITEKKADETVRSILKAFDTRVGLEAALGRVRMPHPGDIHDMAISTDNELISEYDWDKITISKFNLLFTALVYPYVLTKAKNIKE